MRHEMAKWHWQQARVRVKTTLETEGKSKRGAMSSPARFSQCFEQLLQALELSPTVDERRTSSSTSSSSDSCDSDVASSSLSEPCCDRFSECTSGRICSRGSRAKMRSESDEPEATSDNRHKTQAESSQYYAFRQQ